MEGVDRILRMPISREAKSSLLQEEYDYSEKLADLLVQPEGQLNPDLEKLKAMSPLLANKLVDKMPEERVQQLLN